MREIKFRAWDKINEKMYYDVQFNRSEIYTEILNLDFGSLIYMPERFVLMQFTGLTDKNGKEIYEGDVLGGDLDKCFIEYLESEARFAINCIGELHEAQLFEFKSEELEVIGNIYENPELLNNQEQG